MHRYLISFKKLLCDAVLLYQPPCSPLLLTTVPFPPNFVNIHVKHPPEASVQIHQVSQMDTSGQKVKGSQSSTHHTYQHSESSTSHSSHSKIQQQGHTIIYPNQQTYIHYQHPVTSKSQLGRCFQETTGAQVRVRE